VVGPGGNVRVGGRVRPGCAGAACGGSCDCGTGAASPGCGRASPGCASEDCCCAAGSSAGELWSRPQTGNAAAENAKTKTPSAFTPMALLPWHLSLQPLTTMLIPLF